MELLATDSCDGTLPGCIFKGIGQNLIWKGLTQLVSLGNPSMNAKYKGVWDTQVSCLLCSTRLLLDHCEIQEAVLDGSYWTIQKG